MVERGTGWAALDAWKRPKALGFGASRGGMVVGEFWANGRGFEKCGRADRVLCAGIGGWRMAERGTG
ncbi:hypothetical protein JCM16814_26620 [Desulfobaculum senezii]